MRKILALFSLLCLTSPVVADGLLGTGFPITLGTTVVTGSSINATITGLSIAAGGSNTLAALSFAGNGCTLGTDNLCVNGTTTVGNVNVTGSTVPANGAYLSAANTLTLATNTSPRILLSTTSFTANNASGFQMATGATTCTGALALAPNRSGSTNGYSGDGAKDCLVVGGVDKFDVTASGLFFLGTIPGVTGTGTPSITTGSTDTAGEVTGGVSATSIVITFAASKTNAPFCTVTSQTQLAAFTYTISTASITITETATTGDKIDYICFQH